MTSTANGRPPAPVDADGALDFTPAPAKRQRGVTIQLCYHGALVCFTFAADGAPQVHEIEQSIDTLLKRDGWGGAPTGSTTAAKPKAEKVKPFYDGDGAACCPVHRKPLKEGQYGWYCSAKDPSTERGYCALKFTE